MHRRPERHHERATPADGHRVVAAFDGPGFEFNPKDLLARL
jgi:hypothetical protein